MQCPDVRELADSFMAGELPTETNAEVVRHLATCPDCRGEFEARRSVRRAVQRAFDASTELAPPPDYVAALRARLEAAHAAAPRRTALLGVWAIAAAAVLAVSAGLFALHRGALVDLARDAVGDHRNCALEFRLAERPIPLDQAARTFGAAYRVLETLPPTDVQTQAGPARVLARHSCVFHGRRFAHVVLDYRGARVSLLVTERRGFARVPIPGGLPESAVDMPVVFFQTAQHAVFLTGAVDAGDLRALAAAVSAPITARLNEV